jgi:hypothetical protein
MMPVLERPILRNEWAEQTSERNGIAKQTGPGKVEDAGPWEPAVQEIVGFQNLGDDWDGFGAESPSRDVLASAIGLAYCLYQDGVDPPHRVSPGVCGSVIFEWQDADGTYTEVEVDRPLHAEVMVVEPDKPAKQWTLPTE